MEADEVLGRLGSFGIYQKRLFALILVFATANAWAPLTVIFTHYEPNHRCSEEGLQNQSTEPSVSYNGSKSATQNSCGFSSPQNGSNVTIEWECGDRERLFDTTDDGGETLVSEFDLVCSKDWILPLLVCIMMAGKTIGLLFSGSLADRFGRRPVFLVSSVVLFLSTVGMAFSRNTFVYGAFLVISSTTSSTQYTAMCIIGMEMVVPKMRNFVVFTLQAGYVVGYALLPLMAYFAQDWHILLYCVSVGSLIFVFGYWFFPETMHWVLSKGDLKRAEALISDIAAKNGKGSVKAEIVEHFLDKGKDLQKTTAITSFDGGSLFKVSKMRVRLIVSLFVWLVTSFVYYGITLNTSFLPGDRYLNCLAAALMEIPSIAIAYWSLNKFGRPKTSLAFFMASGVTCVSAALIEKVSPVGATVTVIAGKTAVSGAYYIIYIHAAEMAPTLSRNLFVNICSASSHVGSVIAPAIMYIGRRHDSDVYVFIAMGCSSALAGILIFLFLPETLGLPLPDTMQEALEQKTILATRSKRGEKVAVELAPMPERTGCPGKNRNSECL